MQETNFKFEVLIHDDASTDKSAEIIKEYEERYPDIIKPIFQTENQYSKNVPIIQTFMLPKAKGKYIAFCEGDDFWTGKCKLQIQHDVLEKNKTCSICLHPVRVKNLRNPKLLEHYPKTKLKSGIISGDIFMRMRCCEGQYFHFSSYFVTKESYKDFFQIRENYLNLPRTGDLALQIFYGYYGNVYFVNRKMSCYRLNVPNSWSDRRAKLIDENIDYLDTSIVSLNKFNEYTFNKYSTCIDRQINVMNNEKCRLLFLKKINNANLFNIIKAFRRYNKLTINERFSIILLGKFPNVYIKFYG